MANKSRKFITENTRNFISFSVAVDEMEQSLYNTLKDKYYALISDWKSTVKGDPPKNTYEDIAVATFICTLWSSLHYTVKSFVDVGCGNGCLVYILNEEGYSGKGIDTKEFKLWSKFENTQLQKTTLDPSCTAFPESDWIIGNHCDQMAPWIPFIAANSGASTNFILIPCCFYDLNGKRWIPKGPKSKMNDEYMEFLADISKQCGFKVQRFKLENLPSKKNEAIVGIRTNSSKGSVQQDG